MAHMAILHSIGDKLLVCAASKVFHAHLSTDGLSVENTFDVNDALDPVLALSKGAVIVEGREPSSKECSDENVQILCSSLSSCQTLLAVATSSKAVLILNLPLLAVRRSFKIPKAPTTVTFDKDNSHVIVGDRAGHVCRYTVAETSGSGYTDMNGETCLFEGEPLSSAISMVLDVAVSQDGRFMLVADRDEKIRVSRYPQAFVVQSYCLGHSAYVSSIAIHDGRYFSSGGDAVVHEWNIQSGKTIARSEKLGEHPIRRIIIVPNDKSFTIAVIMADTLLFLNEQLRCIHSFKISLPLLDLSVTNGNVVGVTSMGIVAFNLAEETFSMIGTPDEVVQTLSNSKNPISNYYKNVIHQNLVDYYKRKAEKIESSKQNKVRKRKAKQSSVNPDNAKKIAVETQVIAC